MAWPVKKRSNVAQNRVYLCLMHKSCRGGAGQKQCSSRNRCLGKLVARYISLNDADYLAFPNLAYRQKTTLWIFITTPRRTFNPRTINQIHVEWSSICFVSKFRPSSRTCFLFIFLHLYGLYSDHVLTWFQVTSLAGSIYEDTACWFNHCPKELFEISV